MCFGINEIEIFKWWERLTGISWVRRLSGAWGNRWFGNCHDTSCVCGMRTFMPPLVPVSLFVDFDTSVRIPVAAGGRDHDDLRAQSAGLVDALTPFPASFPPPARCG